MRSRFLRLAVLTAPLMLAACGEGWEAQKTTEYMPYGNQRTAGSGVVYVRAKLLPEKELKIEPVAQTPAAEEPKTTLNAEKIFSAAQGKGHTPAAPAVTPKAEKHGSSTVPAKIESVAKPDKAASLLQFEAPDAAPLEKHAANQAAPSVKAVVIPENEIISPKRDFMLLSSEGQRSLSEIYDDTF